MASASLGAPQFRQGETSGAPLPFREADGGGRPRRGLWPAARWKGRGSQWARGARARAFRGRRDLTGERRDGWSPPKARPGVLVSRSSRAKRVCVKCFRLRCVSREGNIPLIRSIRKGIRSCMLARLVGLSQQCLIPVPHSRELPYDGLAEPCRWYYLGNCLGNGKSRDGSPCQALPLARHAGSGLTMRRAWRRQRQKVGL
jgi:hypothetical protein